MGVERRSNRSQIVVVTTALAQFIQRRLYNVEVDGSNPRKTLIAVIVVLLSCINPPHTAHPQGRPHIVPAISAAHCTAAIALIPVTKPAVCLKNLGSKL